MAANYYYGVGAHSMIFIADYDPQTDTVHWADSNMKGKSVSGVRPMSCQPPGDSIG